MGPVAGLSVINVDNGSMPELLANSETGKERAPRGARPEPRTETLTTLTLPLSHTQGRAITDINPPSLPPREAMGGIYTTVVYPGRLWWAYTPLLCTQGGYGRHIQGSMYPGRLWEAYTGVYVPREAMGGIYRGIYTREAMGGIYRAIHTREAMGGSREPLFTVILRYVRLSGASLYCYSRVCKALGSLFLLLFPVYTSKGSREPRFSPLFPLKGSREPLFLVIPGYKAPESLSFSCFTWL